MLWELRAALKRSSRRTMALCAVIVLGVAVTAAHSSVGNEHMGDAAAVCLAVLVAGGTAVAALPTLGRPLPGLPRPVDADRPCLSHTAVAATPPCARGDPRTLQVFRL